MSYREHCEWLDEKHNSSNRTKSGLPLSDWGIEFVPNTLIYMHIYLCSHVPSFFGSISISNQFSLEELLTKISSQTLRYHNGFLNNSPSPGCQSYYNSWFETPAMLNYDVGNNKLYIIFPPLYNAHWYKWGFLHVIFTWVILTCRNRS